MHNVNSDHFKIFRRAFFEAFLFALLFDTLIVLVFGYLMSEVLPNPGLIWAAAFLYFLGVRLLLLELHKNRKQR